MLFLPREDDSGDEKDAQEKINFQIKVIKDKAYELTSTSITDLREYRPVMDIVAQCLKDGEKLYMGTEWSVKRNCILITTADIEGRLNCMHQKGVDLKHEVLQEGLYELTHEFIKDRSEFENISDMLVECLAGIDRFYMAYDWFERLNCCVMLWSTDQAQQRQECAAEKDIIVNPA